MNEDESCGLLDGSLDRDTFDTPSFAVGAQGQSLPCWDCNIESRFPLPVSRSSMDYRVKVHFDYEFECSHTMYMVFLITNGCFCATTQTVLK